MADPSGRACSRLPMVRHCHFVTMDQGKARSPCVSDPWCRNDGDDNPSAPLCRYPVSRSSQHLRICRFLVEVTSRTGSLSESNLQVVMLGAWPGLKALAWPWPNSVPGTNTDNSISLTHPCSPLNSWLLINHHLLCVMSSSLQGTLELLQSINYMSGVNVHHMSYN